MAGSVSWWRKARRWEMRWPAPKVGPELIYLEHEAAENRGGAEAAAVLSEAGH